MGMMIFMHIRLGQMEGARAWANQVVKTAFDCNVLGTETILQNNERAREQYRIAARNLMLLLDDMPEIRGAAPLTVEIRATKRRLDALLHNFENKPETPLQMLREGCWIRRNKCVCLRPRRRSACGRLVCGWTWRRWRWWRS